MGSRPVEPERARRAYRGRQRRRLALLVTLPGLIIGTVSVGGAYSAGLLTRDSAPVCPPVIVAAPERASFPIHVQNSNETKGQGGEVAKELTDRGFLVKGVANAPDGVYVKRAALIYHGPQGRDQALLVAQQIPGAGLWNDGRSGTSVELVIGYGFTGMSYVEPPPPPLPAEISLNVYNTTYRPGLAGDAATMLGNRGFAVDAIGNDPLGAFLPDDVAVIRHGAEGAEAAAVLAQHVKDARLVAIERRGAQLDLLLGNGYTGLVPAKQIPRPAPRPAPTPDTVARPCVS